MKRTLSVIILLLSCISYFEAPKEYSFDYCLWMHNLFLVTALIVFVCDVKNEKVGFNLLFTVSFFFTNFVYPVYIYPIDPQYSLFQFPFNEHVITKCTALAQIAYSAYSCGYLWKLELKQMRVNVSIPFKISNKKVRQFEYFIVVFVVVFIIAGGLEYFEDRYIRSEMSSNMIVQYMMLFFVPIVILFASMIFVCKENSQRRSIYLLLFFISMLLLSSGTRTIPLIIFATLFIIYCQSHKVHFSFVLLCVIVGTMLMSYIGNIRNLGVMTSVQVDESSQFGWLEKFSDLFICNRSLYVFYDFVETRTYTYGVSMISCLLSPIPFAQSTFQNMTGIPYYMLNSPDFSTFLQFGKNPPLGLGTNIVGDVYLAFGLVGCVVLFFFLGWFIVYIRKHMWAGSFMYTIVYLVIASDAIYMCRAAYFDAFKAILWALILAWILIHGERKGNRYEYSVGHSN